MTTENTIQSTNYLEKFENELKNVNFDFEPIELYEPISYLLSLGGKRMRPVLLLMTCELFDGDIDKAIPQAVAIEVFHNFTLMHDDIMDKAPKRRNQLTVHTKWNENTAILSGDVMLVCAYQQLCKSDANLLPQLLNLFNKTAIEVCEGQQFDMNYETQQNVSIAEYLTMIDLKTAVLIGCSLKTGAIVSNASVQDQNDIYEFGRNIGIAFQLQDDILDIYGNPDKFGKQVGGDILSNKKTFLYLKALEIANEQQKDTLLHYFSSTHHDPSKKIEAVIKLYDELEIKKHAQSEMDRYFNIAMKYLDRVSLSSSKKEILIDFTNKLMVRES